MENAVPIGEGVIDLRCDPVERRSSHPTEFRGHVKDNNSVGLLLHLTELDLEGIGVDNAGKPGLSVPEEVGALFEGRGGVFHQPTGDGLVRVRKADYAGAAVGLTG